MKVAGAQKLSGYKGLVVSIIVANIVSLAFLVIKVIAMRSWDYAFLSWNLVLAWLPFLFGYILRIRLTNHRWLTWQNLGLSFLWLVFLPNSFYVASDLIHVRLSSQQNVLYDVVMILSFTLNGLVAGMASLYIVHKELYRRFWANQAHSVIALVILAASFAVYLGRNLRWNTWDVVVHPAALLFDVSDRFINPTDHPAVFATTLTFFVLISSFYFIVWQFAGALHYTRGDEDRD